MRGVSQNETHVLLCDLPGVVYRRGIHTMDFGPALNGHPVESVVRQIC